MNTPHAPRPGDLVALVSFDGDVYANQAVTRDRLGKPPSAPHPLAAAVEQWLGRRPVWIDVHGRQVRGIATARELSARDVWEIDTLVDATGGTGEVVSGLLRQATAAAAEAGVERILLRLATEAPAVEEARRADFNVALQEQLWTRGARELTVTTVSDVEVRDANPEADAFFQFQLYGQTHPFEARQALGMTFDDWRAAQDRRWAKGARELLAFEDGRARAAIRATSVQMTLLAEPGFERAATATLAAAEQRLDARAFALQPDAPATPAGVLRDHGFEPTGSFTVLALRTMRPVREEQREAIRTRTVVPSGG